MSLMLPLALQLIGAPTDLNTIPALYSPPTRILPAVLFRSPLSLALLQIPTLPLNILFSAVDGFSRIVGITTFGVDTVISHSDPAVANSPWAMIVIATLAGGGGGLIVPAFKGFHADWAFGTPPWAKEGPGIDVWGATLIGYIYS